MTTAHRPTFDPARGKEAARGEAYHQRLLPAHKTLKYRQPLQGNPQEQASRDLKAELLRSEARAQAKKEGRELDDDEDIKDSALRIESRADTADDEVESGVKRKLAETSTGDAEEEDYEAKKRRVLAETKEIDADSDAASEASSEESDSDDDEEDETAQLMAELAKIKAERAEAAAKVAAEQARKDEVQREKDIALGNPLLNGGSAGGSGGGGAEYGVKRRWDDDVVFKNQGRGTEERGKEKRFVNDLLRSDFHRRFMDKYVR
ncbi:complexed with cef1p [Recurvomyces mirabilis]|nr:complexed with cef1p [Recurvomyces mirabilis]